MLTYPASIIGYFCVGMGGAITFLFLLLMFDKEVAILENRLVGHQQMGFIYILLGGFLSVVVNLAGNPDFGASQLTIAFSTGLGWPAIAAGFSAGKRIGEINEDKIQIAGMAKNLVAMKDNRLAERETFYKNILDKNKESLELMQKIFEKELDEIRSYYAGKRSSTGGE
jgi:hypothetical protein